MNGQLSLADAQLRPAEVPLVLLWRKRLRQTTPPAGGKVSVLTFRAVGTVLADHADAQGGSCWPAVATIASEAGVSPRSAVYALTALVRVGLLSRRNRGRKSTSYRLRLPVENPVEKPA